MHTISAYTTSRNPKEMDYPFQASVRSFKALVDELVVCDTSDDPKSLEGHWEALVEEFAADGKVLKVVRDETVNWSAPNFAIYDGQTKAYARSNCTGKYLIQFDLDEIMDPQVTRDRMEFCCNNLSEENPLLALPIIEYWGSEGKVRIDINPWKPRLSLNLPNITHGIPGHLRKYDKNGLLRAQYGTDSCDYIDTKSLKNIPWIGFMKAEINEIRVKAIHDKSHVQKYEQWYKQITQRLPTIHHLSWWSIYSKMKKWQKFYNAFWISLYDEQRPDNYNPFFPNRSLDTVVDEEMKELAKTLEVCCGGHIFHSPIDPVNLPKTNWCSAKNICGDQYITNWIAS
jgi:hypothetical protein